MKSYGERMVEWREQERQRYLNLEPRLKNLVTPKIVKLYIESEAFQMLDECIPEYRAYGQRRLAGGLQRSINARFKRLSNEMDAVGIKPMIQGQDRHKVFMYLQEKYKNEVWNFYKKEHKKRFGYVPERK